ncbi:DUF4296 domain-containing protein [Neotamlana laminarinivorans]|uniref:DUF4296 domain-containing protein n=1 Tax=Neotamlana laminarinivorans TaxID=2883124 RepID=A0A9X1L3P5_9FLAO|nr:DUF4296 domain-containing protein [Tamlana laminarinivorans]MCB4798462.1 DUF4296 domain-containing protein [Tamlana laminarinivorans]
MNLKALLLFFCIICFAISCKKDRGPEKPDNLLSKQQMVEVLIDAKILGSSSSVDKRLMREHGVDIKTYVYEKHNIDSLQFALSNNYYAFHLEDYKTIYEMVNDSLEALKTKFKEQESKEWKESTKREEDSLKNLNKTKTEQNKDVKINIAKDSLSKTKDSLRAVLKNKKLPKKQ